MMRNEYKMGNNPKMKPYPKYKPSGIDWIGEIPERRDVARRDAKFCVSTMETIHNDETTKTNRVRRNKT